MTKQSQCDALYMSDDPNETTFMNDEQLPALPVPSLEESVAKLLDTCEPVADTWEQFDQLQRTARDFLTSERGHKLQEKLLKRAAANRNWLEQWWLEFAYLRNRRPLIPYSNMVCPMPPLECWPTPCSSSERCRRMALATYYQMCFWQMLRHERMRPQVQKGIAWSMSQFQYLFNTCRMPGEPQDTLENWFTLAKDGPSVSNEIIVLHRGHLFAISAVSADGHHLVEPPDLERHLLAIEKYAQQQPGEGPGLGALTTCDRSEWAHHYRYIQRLAECNERSLDRIARALSVIVLDQATPVTSDEIYRLSLCGDPCNRWADKSIASLAFANGTFGAMADHTPYDGFCTSIMTHYVRTRVTESEGRWESGSAATEYTGSWEPLEFVIDTKVEQLIGQARDEYHKQCDNIDTIHRSFDAFGKEGIKELRIHPEAFVQCAIHLAYYRQHRQAAPTYVTATTRRFYRGRTETCRSCFPEMYSFAKAMVSPDRIGDQNLVQLLRQATDKFQRLMKEACDGRGADRHLMGLYLIALLEEDSQQLPELFTDPVVERNSNYVLSTSCSGYWNVCGGIPPLIDDGYGCFYGIDADSITICCTAIRSSPITDVEQFYANLTRSLIDIRALVNRTSASKL